MTNTVIFSTAALPLAWYYSVDLGPISLLTDTLRGLAVGVLMGRLQLPQVENTFEQRLAHMLSMSIMAAVITNGVRFSLATSDSVDSLLRASLLAVLVSMVIVIAKSLVQQVTARAS